MRLVLAPEAPALGAQPRRPRLHLAARCHAVVRKAQGGSGPQRARRLARHEPPRRPGLTAERSPGLTGVPHPICAYLSI